MPRCEGWCGLCYSNVRGRSNYKHHAGYRKCNPFKEVKQVAFELKPRLQPQGDEEAFATVDDPFEGVCPALYAHLTHTVWPDGKKRLASTMIVFCEQGRWKACLNAKDEELTAWVSADSFAGLWEALEVGLQQDRLDWRKAGKKFKR